MKSYPVNLVGLEDRRCIVVGGGALAARKSAGLVAAGARPVVISPTIHPDLNNMLEAGQVEYLPRPFHQGDLDGVLLVVAATDDPALNQQVWEAACCEGILVNVVDSPWMCNFFTPAVLRHGDFVVSISTGGDAPALASRLRREIENRFGQEYEVLTAWCAAIRPAMLEVFPDPEERKARWYTLIDSPVLTLLSTARHTEARAWIEENLGARLADLLPPEPRGQSGEQ